MTVKTFLDTNIFIYSIDTSRSEKKKREVAQEIVTEHLSNNSGVISTQVLQEFYQVSTQKIKVPLSTKDALEFLHHISVFETIQPDFHMIVAAIHLHKKYKLSFWDALIMQSAITAGCANLLSEDLQDGFRLEDLVVTNPFRNEP